MLSGERDSGDALPRLLRIGSLALSRQAVAALRFSHPCSWRWDFSSGLPPGVPGVEREHQRRADDDSEQPSQIHSRLP